MNQIEEQIKDILFGLVGLAILPFVFIVIAFVCSLPILIPILILIWLF